MQQAAIIGKLQSIQLENRNTQSKGILRRSQPESLADNSTDAWEGLSNLIMRLAVHCICVAAQLLDIEYSLRQKTTSTVLLI